MNCDWVQFASPLRLEMHGDGAVLILPSNSKKRIQIQSVVDKINQALQQQNELYRVLITDGAEGMVDVTWKKLTEHEVLQEAL